MQNLFSKIKYPLLAFLVSFGVLFFFYHEVLLHLNDYLFSAHGDGIKNYYTYIFHAKYDDSFHHFSGMNYPYYEHIVYTDAHPLLSWCVGRLGLAGYAVGILNFLILISYPVATVFIHRILKHYKVSELWAIAGAVVITFMTPQVFRMTGHFSMSYIFAVPLMWWLLIKCYSTHKWIWTVLTGLYLLAFFFTHPYLGMILVFFSIVFWLLNAIANRKKLWRYLGYIFVQTILPIVAFQGYVAATDSHVDRLSNPAGFFHYYASWKSLVVAHDGPLSHIYSYFKVNIGNWESWAYLGGATIVFIVIIAVYLIKTRSDIAWKDFWKKELVLFFISAHLILLFAFCFPLKYDWMRWVTDLFGPLKQFRILGRFTWIFFYVCSTASIVGLYHIYKKTGKAWFQYIFFGGIILCVFEFYPPHKNTSNYISQAKNAFKPENIDADFQTLIDFANEGEYDAILFLPFQHMSSENIMLLGAEQANYDAFLLSYYTNIPLINSISSRMSLTESIKVNNYFSPAFIEKELTYDLPEDAKILLVKNRDLLKVNELRMTWEFDPILESGPFTAFDFDPEKWNSRERFDKIMAKNARATSPLINDWRSDTSEVWYYYDGFDETDQTEIKLSGQGALMDNKSSWNTILTLDSSQIDPGNYVVRFWYYLRVDRPDVNAIVEQQFQGDREAEWSSQFDVKQATHIIADWCMIEMEFILEPDFNHVNFLITGNGSGEPFVIDELLIQKMNDHALFKTEEINGETYVVYDNYRLRKNSFE